MDLRRALFTHLPAKIIALFSALFLWTVAVLDRTYDIQIEVPVEITEKGGEERVITDVDTRTVTVTINGKGKELLRLSRGKLVFKPTIPEGRFGLRRIKLNPADLKLPGGIIVRAIEPEVVEVKLGPASTREVRIAVPTKGQPGSGMMLSAIRVNTPVRLIGPATEIENYPQLNTETLDLSTVKSNETRKLSVIPPKGSGFSCVPESVEVEVMLRKESARIFLGIPVKIQAPPGVDVAVDPAEAQIAVAGPAELIDTLKPSDISVQIKISSLKPGEYRLGADVTLPEYFRLVKIEPELFDITIR